MRFSTIIFSAALAGVSIAQSNSTSASGAVVPTTTYALTPAQSSQATCLAACPADDALCRSKCIVINEGDYAQQNRTIDCVSACPKGNGTEADNLTFENCQKGCLASATVTPATTRATATGTGSGSAATGTGSGNSGDVRASGTSGGSGGSATQSGSAAASSSGSAADNVRVGALAGFVGLGSLAFVFGL